jgi:hypothetical protein
MNVPGKRLILGAAVAVAALGVGGVAYATSGDPVPAEQGYVTIEDGATTPSPGTGEGRTGRNGADCPEKNGQGQGSQGEGQQTQPSQPQTQPEQSQPDAAENA